MNDRDLILRMAELDCLYARAGRPASEVMRDALALDPRAGTLVTWALAGQVTGCEWCACSDCGEVRLMVPTGLKHKRQEKYTEDPPPAHPYCKMTPRCLGYMVRLAKRPVMSKGLREALNA